MPFSQREFIKMLYFGSPVQERKLDLAQTVVKQPLLHACGEGKGVCGLIAVANARKDSFCCFLCLFW